MEININNENREYGKIILEGVITNLGKFMCHGDIEKIRYGGRFGGTVIDIRKGDNISRYCSCDFLDILQENFLRRKIMIYDYVDNYLLQIWVSDSFGSIKTEEFITKDFYGPLELKPNEK